MHEQLAEHLRSLSPSSRARLDRLFDIRVVNGETRPPPELEAWLTATFGSVEAVRRQTVVKITNLATLEATLFAPLRGRRPMDGVMDRSLADELERTRDDPFCHPLTGTPADMFGRVEGRHMVSGANAALADAHHAVLVFDRHDPLAIDEALVADLFATGRAWADRARVSDPDAANYLLIWNSLWRAGGSIVHGHAQALLGSGPHYARLERYRRDAASYEVIHGSPLVDDLVDVHRDLGLVVEGDAGVVTLAHLTPIKEREVVVVGRRGMDERDVAFTSAVARAVTSYVGRLGVRSFNLALWRPPLTDGDIAAPGWTSLPPIVRMVDRGDLATRPSDIGAMELYGTPIVGGNPWEVVDALA